MASDKFTITFDVEPICKVTCAAQDCRFNLIHREYGLYCSLKYIDVDELGRCGMFEPIKRDEVKAKA